MHPRSLSRSRAEILFAELLVEQPEPSADHVGELCAAHPDLAPELERLHAEMLAVRSLMPGWAPAGDGVTRPPDMGAFRCLRLLGRGGMGEVWEAMDLALGRTVALKLLRDSWTADVSQGKRFLREAQAAGRVRHPAIVAVFQTGEHEGRRYIVQELVPGGRTLRDEIDELRRRGELPADHARRVGERFVTLAGGLAAAHEAGVVHRDIKPQNVLIAPSGEPKIADFGLARLLDDASLSHSGFLGTYLYASPEQIDGGRAVDERSDVFSLGATLYETLTLRRPFEGGSVGEVARAVTSLDPPPPHVATRRVPRELSLICMKALEKRPEARYASMTAFADDLLRYLSGRPVVALAPSAARRALKWAVRHPTATTALGLSLAATIAMAGLFLRSESLRRAAERAGEETSAANASLRAATEELRTESVSREEVIAFLVGMFEQVDPDVSGDRVPSLREIVQRARERLAGGEVEEPIVRARLLGSLGAVSAKLGDYAGAKELLQEALATFERTGAMRSAEASDALLFLSGALLHLGELEGAEARLAPLLERMDAGESFGPRFDVEVLITRGEHLMRAGRFAEADLAFGRAEQACRLSPPEEARCLSVEIARATSQWGQGQLDQAEASFRGIIEENEERLRRAEPRVLNAVNGRGLVLVQQGRFAEAEELFLSLGEDLERSLDAHHPNLLTARLNLALVWESAGRLSEAEALYREIVSVAEERFGPGDPTVLRARNNLGTCLVRQGRAEEAEATHREVFEARQLLLGEADPETLSSQNNLAYALLKLGRVAEAHRLQERVVARTAAADPNLPGRRKMLEDLRALVQVSD